MIKEEVLTRIETCLLYDESKYVRKTVSAFLEYLYKKDESLINRFQCAIIQFAIEQLSLR